jgi:hypothetical protein
MQAVASISAMQQFHFGRGKRCSDSEEGLLTQVVFDSASRRMIALLLCSLNPMITKTKGKVA